MISSYHINRAHINTFLTALPAAGGMSQYAPPGLSAEAAVNHLIRFFPDGPPEDIVKAAATSPTGYVIIRGYDKIWLVLPPFAVKDEMWFSEMNPAPLLQLVETDYHIAFVLARMGAYAVGMAKGEALVSSKVGTGLVHGRHRQGGSSANRFARHRLKQAEYFFTRVCERAREHIGPYVNQTDYLVWGGARTTILALQKQCGFLAGLKTPALPQMLDIPDPRKVVLEQALSRVYTTTVLEWAGE
ncbi:Vms1/Ankzf1 family peptidyl-tRNA hydrolase [Chloroflexota bacterium]